MFRRGRKASAEASPDPDEARGGRDVDRPGPYDAEAAPQDDIHRLDLGALRVPALRGVQVQFQVEESTGRPLTVVVTDGRSAMELAVFAAPRTAPLWDEVRAEILETLRDSGGVEGQGPFGAELRMRLPTNRPGETVPGRMIGVDGPRWFLRAVVTGAAGQDVAAGPLLDETLRRIVVVRGDEAMPVRDPLPLRLPKEVADGPEGSGDSGGAGGSDGPSREVTPGTATAAPMPVRGTRIAEMG
ncbi:hypothetical protein CC117_11760 [Parafrankia colletiae]|uniref:DUF3710 domain-containing protein n=1 Tax=Parafrankia colletiae TaxID=573497 RepID=A0A1S1RB84_9ACTN|nr:DUF3710 domain-containing protein [Parafrankia colletiae]MCK9900857.1 DUF3710 domain-containing protein [Frankia sp. Cpl3]OHV43266.1 hypothetical protein CC117_11760 [Parafrankia colletiae]